jgi:hypothetical protein
MHANSKILSSYYYFVERFFVASDFPCFENALKINKKCYKTCNIISKNLLCSYLLLDENIKNIPNECNNKLYFVVKNPHLSNTSESVISTCKCLTGVCVLLGANIVKNAMFNLLSFELDPNFYFSVS